MLICCYNCICHHRWVGGEGGGGRQLKFTAHELIVDMMIKMTMYLLAPLRSHHADSTTAPLAARASTSDLQDCRPGLPVSDWPGTGVSGRRLSASDVSTHRLQSTNTAMCVVRRSNNSFSDRCFAAAGPSL